MAISLQTLRGQKNTSIHGRRLALDREDNVVGPTGYREAVFELTSASTAQTLSKYGMTEINATSANTTATNAYFIPNPTPGLSVKFSNGVAGTTSTQGSTSLALQRATSAFYIDSSEGTTMVAALLPFGSAITLTGMTTDRYKVTGRSGSLGLTGTS